MARATMPRPMQTALRAIAVWAAALAASTSAVAAADNRGRIEAVVLKQGYAAGYGGAISVSYRPIVLFKDGSYTTDANAALQPRARVDGRWRRAGDAFALTAADGKSFSVPARMLARPAAAGSTIEGRYRSLSGVGAVGMNVPVVAAWKSMQFSRDGTVVADQGAGAAADGLATASQRSTPMRYRLDGYAITLTPSGGVPTTRLFYVFPDGDNVVGIGASTLSARR